jgi:hypothetical protein
MDGEIVASHWRYTRTGERVSHYTTDAIESSSIFPLNEKLSLVQDHMVEANKLKEKYMEGIPKLQSECGAFVAPIHRRASRVA